MRVTSRERIGVEEGQARRTGTIGVTVLGRGARERIRLMGISGRLRNACQGQAEGLSVSRRSNILTICYWGANGRSVDTNSLPTNC